MASTTDCSTVTASSNARLGRFSNTPWLSGREICLNTLVWWSIGILLLALDDYNEEMESAHLLCTGTDCSGSLEPVQNTLQPIQCERDVQSLLPEIQDKPLGTMQCFD